MECVVLKYTTIYEEHGLVLSASGTNLPRVPDSRARKAYGHVVKYIDRAASAASASAAPAHAPPEYDKLLDASAKADLKNYKNVFDDTSKSDAERETATDTVKKNKQLEAVFAGVHPKVYNAAATTKNAWSDLFKASTDAERKTAYNVISVTPEFTHITSSTAASGTGPVIVMAAPGAPHGAAVVAAASSAHATVTNPTEVDGMPVMTKKHPLHSAGDVPKPTVPTMKASDNMSGSDKREWLSSTGHIMRLRETVALDAMTFADKVGLYVYEYTDPKEGPPYASKEVYMCVPLSILYALCHRAGFTLFHGTHTDRRSTFVLSGGKQIIADAASGRVKSWLYAQMKGVFRDGGMTHYTRQDKLLIAVKDGYFSDPDVGIAPAVFDDIWDELVSEMGFSFIRLLYMLHLKGPMHSLYSVYMTWVMMTRKMVQCMFVRLSVRNSDIGTSSTHKEIHFEEERQEKHKTDLCKRLANFAASLIVSSKSATQTSMEITKKKIYTAKVVQAYHPSRLCTIISRYVFSESDRDAIKAGAPAKSKLARITSP
jgi:hypothetical protein